MTNEKELDEKILKELDDFTACRVSGFEATKNDRICFLKTMKKLIHAAILADRKSRELDAEKIIAHCDKLVSWHRQNVRTAIREACSAFSAPRQVSVEYINDVVIDIFTESKSAQNDTLWYDDKMTLCEAVQQAINELMSPKKTPEEIYNQNGIITGKDAEIIRQDMARNEQSVAEYKRCTVLEDTPITQSNSSVAPAPQATEGKDEEYCEWVVEKIDNGELKVTRSCVGVSTYLKYCGDLDNCVYKAIKGLLGLGCKVVLLLDATKSVSNKKKSDIINEFVFNTSGIMVTTSDAFLFPNIR